MLTRLKKKINPKYLSTKVKILKRMQKLVKYSIRFKKFLKISKSFEIQKILKRLLVILKHCKLLLKMQAQMRNMYNKKIRGKKERKAIIWFSSIYCLEVCTGNRNDHFGHCCFSMRFLRPSK